MEEKFKNLLLETKLKPEPYLARNIINIIALKEKRNARIKLGVLSTLGIFSFFALIPVIQNLLTSLSSSGFYEYVSIAFSNSEILLENWRELGLSLIESLPMLGTILSLGLIFVFFLSFKQAGRQIESARLAF